MDLRELLKDAAWSVEGSPELPQRARRRYVRARVRRVANGAIAVVAGVAVIAGVATIAPIGDDGGDVSEGQVVHIDKLQDAYFVDTVNAYAVERGADPSVAASSDGGVSWRTVGRIDTDVEAPLGREVVFLDNDHGLVWGGGALHTTADGGATWSDTDGEFLTVGPSRADASVWALTGCTPDESNCRPKVEQSTDDGVSWRPTSSPVLGTTEHQLLGISSNVAYVLDPGSGDGGANLWRTDDSGATWTPRKSPCINSVMGRTAAPRTGMLWMLCAEPPGADAQIAVAWRSFDDGQSWAPADGSGTNLAPHQAKIADFKAMSEQIAVIALDDGAIYSTVDGGTSWHHRFDLPEGSHPVLGVRAGKRVWAMTTADSPVHGLWMSADSVTWARVDENETVEPTIVGRLPPGSTAISFRDAMNGWLQSSDGFWYTVDRGSTWQQMTMSPAQPEPPIDPDAFAETLPCADGDRAAISAADLNTLWLVCSHDEPTGIVAHVWRSVDAGDTWTVAENQGNTLPDLVSDIAAFSPVTAYVTVPGEGVYATFDGGTTWSRRVEGTVVAIESIPLVRTWVLVLGEDGRQTLTESRDGLTWRAVAKTP